MNPTAGYAGFYINLDRSADRRAEIEAQLAKFKLAERYQRFPAADGNALGLPNPHLSDAEMGCFTSHYLVLKANLGSPSHLHVVEDDVVFSAAAERLVSSVFDNPPLAQYDIVCTDTYVDFDQLRRCKQLYDASVPRTPDGAADIKFQIIDLKGMGFALLSSYVVNRDSIGKLHDLCAAELANGPRRPIDLFLREKLDDGTLKIASIFPFVTSTRIEHLMGTTIEGRYDMLSPLAAAIARHSFFVECDWQKCRDWVAEFLGAPTEDPHADVLASVFRFALTPRFQRF